MPNINTHFADSSTNLDRFFRGDLKISTDDPPVRKMSRTKDMALYKNAQDFTYLRQRFVRGDPGWVTQYHLNDPEQRLDLVFTCEYTAALPSIVDDDDDDKGVDIFRALLKGCDTGLTSSEAVFNPTTHTVMKSAGDTNTCMSRPTKLRQVHCYRSADPIALATSRKRDDHIKDIKSTNIDHISGTHEQLWSEPQACQSDYT
jgi:hypothetical protein